MALAELTGWVVGVFVAFLGIGVLYAWICSFITRKQAEANPPPETVPMVQTVTVRVTVADMFCSTGWEGSIKVPKSVRYYTVVFRDENKEIHSLSVPEECYDGFEIGQVGDLTMKDGELYSFVLVND